MNKFKWLTIFGLALLISGCTNLPTAEIPQTTNQITLAPTLTPMPPTATRLPTATRWPTDTLTPSPTSLPAFTVDGLHFAYIIDGNLYVQDSGGQPVQLTHSGEDQYPIFSDDGRKIVFYRGQDSDLNKIYSINADGSQEQVLVTTDLLVSLNLGYDEFTEPSGITFVPGTHNLLFYTQESKPTENNQSPPLVTTDTLVKFGLGYDEFAAKPNDAAFVPRRDNPFFNILESKLLGNQVQETSNFNVEKNRDTFLVDSDTAEITQLATAGNGGAFQFSPDGKLDIKSTGKYIDVININEQVVRRHMITYLPEWVGEGINLG